MSTSSIMVSAQQTPADISFREWMTKVNRIVMATIAEFHKCEVNELDFDIEDLPDHLYRISHDEGVSAENMALVVFTTYKKMY